MMPGAGHSVEGEKVLRAWEDTPEWMRTPEVKEYFDILEGKRGSLLLKRAFDVVASTLLLIILSPLMAIIAVWIAVDSPGGVFFRQSRVTSYGKLFRIHKFRTMARNAEQAGTSVTIDHDARITRIGGFLRKYRLDEIPQLLDILVGNMSFVGTRPEVPNYVQRYTPEMMATLLLPAGVTSQACVFYREELRDLEGAKDVDDAYVNIVLPKKMEYNLAEIRHFSFWQDIRVLILTVVVVAGFRRSAGKGGAGAGNSQEEASLNSEADRKIR